MFKILKCRRFSVLEIPSCLYSSSNENRAVSEKVPLNISKENVTSKNLENTTQDDIKWRTPWHQREGQYYSTLRTFYTEHNNTNVIKFLQTPINFTPSAIKTWWARKQENKAIIMQQYLPERNQTLGNELAAAHFIIHRGGSVKFFGQDYWIKANQYNNYSLPSCFQPNLYLQAIDCTDMELYYEGLVNMQDLKQIEWFSINGSEKMDDWCMDRITNIFARTLLYLDIRDCQNISCRGLAAIAKMEKLKILYVSTDYSNEFEMTCLMLQQVLPDLDIRYE